MNRTTLDWLEKPQFKESHNICIENCSKKWRGEKMGRTFAWNQRYMAFPDKYISQPTHKTSNTHSHQTTTHSRTHTQKSMTSRSPRKNIFVLRFNTIQGWCMREDNFTGVRLKASVLLLIASQWKALLHVRLM